MFHGLGFQLFYLKLLIITSHCVCRRHIRTLLVQRRWLQSGGKINLNKAARETKARGVLLYISYMGLCRTLGYGFRAVLV